MNGIENYLGFIVAAIIMNLTPGADTVYILTRSISQGKKAGIYSVLGIGTGAIVHIFLAAFGLSVILMQSMTLFLCVKWIGAAYLIYLGIKSIKDKSNLFGEDQASIEQLDVVRIWRQGFFTNLLNPKVAIFFLSLLPQFIKPDFVHNATPFLILGFSFLCTGTIWCMFLAYAASSMTQTLRNNDHIGKWMQKISGVVFITLGLQLLFKNK